MERRRDKVAGWEEGGAGRDKQVLHVSRVPFSFGGICPIKNQMWNGHAGHSLSLSLYMPLLISQCSLLFAAAAFTTLIMFT